MIKSEQYSLRKRLNRDSSSFMIINSENQVINNLQSKFSPQEISEVSKIIDKSKLSSVNYQNQEIQSINKDGKKRILKCNSKKQDLIQKNKTQEQFREQRNSRIFKIFEIDRKPLNNNINKKSNKNQGINQKQISSTKQENEIQLFETCKLQERPLSDINLKQSQLDEFKDIDKVICKDFQMKLSNMFNTQKLGLVQIIHGNQFNPKQIGYKDKVPQCKDFILLELKYQNKGIKLRKRIFQCKFENNCNKLHSGPSKFYDHLRTHTLDKPYSCEICLQSFSQRSNLNSHLNEVHLKIKQFICQMCNKIFTKAYNLNVHSPGCLKRQIKSKQSKKILQNE